MMMERRRITRRRREKDTVQEGEVKEDKEQ